MAPNLSSVIQTWPPVISRISFRFIEDLEGWWGSHPHLFSEVPGFISACLATFLMTFSCLWVPEENLGDHLYAYEVWGFLCGEDDDVLLGFGVV